MLDWSLFKDYAGGHHLISLLLHIGVTLLLFFFLNRTTNNLWSSAFAAALFALHPLRVESVAWAAERKDILSMFFGIASIYAYSYYAESYKLSKYFLCLILFALSLMAKPMLCYCNVKMSSLLQSENVTLGRKRVKSVERDTRKKEVSHVQGGYNHNERDEQV